MHYYFQGKLITVTEQMLIEIAKEGRPEALEEIYQSNHSRVFHLALRYVHFPEDAEDIVQETFLKVFYGIHTFDINLGAGLSAWINRICIHCAIDHLRVRKRRGGELTSLDALPQDPPSSSPSPEQITIEQRVSHRVQNAVDNLSPRQQMIFAMRYREHMNIRQIAVRLECSEGNVRSQLFRSATKLRNVFRTDS